MAFGLRSVVVNQGELERLLNSPDGPVARELLRIGSRVEAEAKRLLSNRLVNVDTGRLRSSTTHVLTRGVGRSIAVVVGSGADYGIHVHEGTRYVQGRPYLTIAAQTVLGGSR